MPYETIYTAEFDEEDQAWSVINESSITGHTVLYNLDEATAKLMSNCMNEVYNQVIEDIRG